MLNYSASEENYLKAIYHLQQKDSRVTTNELAAELHTRPASVTDMMKKLKGKKLLNYEPYQGFRLTAEGKKVALGIIRRHRLWEYFLAEKLKFAWDEVHEVAEQLEHVSSKKLVDKLDEYLGFPRTDPHGDPIPGPDGKMKVAGQIPLNQVPLNKPAIVCQVGGQSVEMLELLKQKKIAIGTRIEVKKKSGFDQSLEIKIRNLPVFTITEKLAQNIFVKV